MTKAEKEWCDFLISYGCYICRLRNFGYIYPQVHHILKSGRRIDHLHTLPLCFSCHESGVNTTEFVSRHPWKREFERRYGPELDMLAEVQRAYREFKR